MLEEIVGRGLEAGLRALVEPAPALTFAQIKSVLEAVNSKPPGGRWNQLHGAYSVTSWNARANQAIIRPFLEQYVVRDGLLAGQSPDDVRLFYGALAYSCTNAEAYGH